MLVPSATISSMAVGIALPCFATSTILRSRRIILSIVKPSFVQTETALARKPPAAKETTAISSNEKMLIRLLAIDNVM